MLDDTILIMGSHHFFVAIFFPFGEKNLKK